MLAAVRDVREPTEAEHLLREREDAVMLTVDRETIAMDVNAGVIHTLFGISLHLQSSAGTTFDQRARNVMEKAVEDIDEAISEVREHIFRHRGQAPL